MQASRVRDVSEECDSGPLPDAWAAIHTGRWEDVTMGTFLSARKLRGTVKKTRIRVLSSPPELARGPAATGHCFSLDCPVQALAMQGCSANAGPNVLPFS